MQAGQAAFLLVRLIFTPHGQEDYTHWLAADRATFKRINRRHANSQDRRSRDLNFPADPTNGTAAPARLRHYVPPRTFEATGHHRGRSARLPH
jgi:hypothetical protein